MQGADVMRALQGSISLGLPRLPDLRGMLGIAYVLLASALALICCSLRAEGNEMSEYQLKAAYLYNFVTFTEWPADMGATLTLCIYGPDAFGADIDKLQSANVNGRTIQLQRSSTVDQLDSCNIVFVSSDVISNLPRVLDRTDNKPVLTVADSLGAAAAGVSLNMTMEEDKVTFEVNLDTVNSSGLGINFQLLRLAKKVYK
jgi:hypothetical protein